MQVASNVLRALSASAAVSGNAGDADGSHGQGQRQFYGHGGVLVSPYCCRPEPSQPQARVSCMTRSPRPHATQARLGKATRLGLIDFGLA